VDQRRRRAYRQRRRKSSAPVILSIDVMPESLTPADGLTVALQRRASPMGMSSFASPTWSVGPRLEGEARPISCHSADVMVTGIGAVSLLL